MEEKKSINLSLSTVLLFVAILVIGVMAYYIYCEKTNYNKQIVELETNTTNLQNTIDNLQGKIDSISNTISNNNENTSNTISNNNKNASNIDNISYIVVQVEDTTAGELAYKSKKITNKQKIEGLMNIVNNAIEYEPRSYIHEFGDIPPRVEIYNSNGEKYTIFAGDQINDDGNVVNLMTKWYKQDESDKTLYKVESKLEEYIENLYNS